MNYVMSVSSDCDLCSECVDTCDNSALSINQGLVVFDSTDCVFCEVCMDVCEKEAIIIEHEE